MAAIKYSKYRLLILLFIGLLCIYASQAISILNEVNNKTTAREGLLFMVGSILYLFFDCMLPLKEKQNKILNTNNIIYVGYLLVFADWAAVIIYDIHLLSWLNMVIYTAYFVHLIIRIWRHKSIIS